MSEPDEVGLPAISFSSLMPMGNPSSARVRWPLAYFASALRARSIASSKWVKVKALMGSFTASARAMTACINSTGDRVFARNRAKASCAGR